MGVTLSENSVFSVSNLTSVALAFESVGEILSATIHMEAIQQHFPALLFLLCCTRLFQRLVQD